jgi:hypothetical protein
MAVGLKDNVIIALVGDGPVQTVSSSETTMQGVDTVLINGCEIFLTIDFKGSILNAVSVSTNESWWNDMA